MQTKLNYRKLLLKMDQGPKYKSSSHKTPQKKTYRNSIGQQKSKHQKTKWILTKLILCRDQGSEKTTYKTEDNISKSYIW